MINKKIEKIDKVLKRGVSAIYPNEDFLKAKLLKGEKMKIYLGIDPTGELHLGHTIPLRKLRHFQDLGHKIIVLIGDFTGTVGDPTGKLSTRKVLTSAQVKNNAKKYKTQISKILKTGFGGVIFKNNSDWWGKTDLKKFLEILSLETVDRLIERDMFQERKLKKQPIFLHEFLYPILQGYDSVALDIDGEVGGNDQIFNMLSGRDFVKNILNREKFVLSTKLLTDNTGKKMGKTEGNMVNLSDSPEDMFGKLMRLNDSLIISGFELLTDVSDEEIKVFERQLKEGENPRNIKIKLAEEITAFWHGRKTADKVKENFIKTFSEKNEPVDPEEIFADQNELLVEVFIKNGIVPSKSEFGRLIKSGAIKKFSGEKIFDPRFLAKAGGYKVGKRLFVKIINN